MQDQPRRSACLLSGLRYTLMDAGVRGCMRPGMRLPASIRPLIVRFGRSAGGSALGPLLARRRGDRVEPNRAARFGCWGRPLYVGGAFRSRSAASLRCGSSNGAMPPLARDAWGCPHSYSAPELVSAVTTESRIHLPRRDGPATAPRRTSRAEWTQCREGQRKSRQRCHAEGPNASAAN